MKHTEKTAICSALTDDIFMKISKIEMTSSSYFPVRTCSSNVSLHYPNLLRKTFYNTRTNYIYIYSCFMFTYKMRKSSNTLTE